MNTTPENNTDPSAESLHSETSKLVTRRTSPPHGGENGVMETPKWDKTAYKFFLAIIPILFVLLIFLA